MSSPFAESALEGAVFDGFGAVDCEVARYLAPGEPAAETNDFRETIRRARVVAGLPRG